MLVLERRPGQAIDITLEDGRRITITTLGVDGNKVRYGVAAPRTVTVDREAVTARKRLEKLGAAGQIDGNIDPDRQREIERERILEAAGLAR